MNKWKIRALFALSILIIAGLLTSMVIMPGQPKGVYFEQLPFRDISHYAPIASMIRMDEQRTDAWQLDANAYTRSDNWRHAAGLKLDLRYVDSLYPDHYRNIEVLCKAITKENPYWRGNDLDSLNLLLTWAVTLNCAEEGESEYRLLLMAAYRYWMNELSSRLNALAKADHGIRYTFKFKYLRERCRLLAYGVDVTDDSSTKIVNNIVERKWYYLIVDRLWGATSWAFRSLLLLIAGLTIWGYMLIVKKIIKTVWKN